MTAVRLLEELKSFTEDTVRDMILPCRFQKGDYEESSRPAKVFLMRLTKSDSAQKAAPYILHQAINARDIQPVGQRVSGRAVIRSIFCVFNEDEQEGGMMLLNLMERMRVALLHQIVIGNRFELDLTDGLESLIYPEDTAPYYMGEMASTWVMPKIEREVNFDSFVT